MRRESIQHFIQVNSVIGNARREVLHLIYHDLATLTHKLLLLLKITGSFEIHSLEALGFVVSWQPCDLRVQILQLQKNKK